MGLCVWESYILLEVPAGVMTSTRRLGVAAQRSTFLQLEQHD